MTKLKGKARARSSSKKRNKQKNDYFVRKKNLIKEIRKYDDPILFAPCETISEGENVRDIFKKMKQVLNATKNGVGLASSQIGIPKRMIIVKPDSDSSTITCMINPKIESTSCKMKFGKEGCLSYPEIYALVERFISIEVSYYDEDWKKHIVEYEEGKILSIVIQHEMEHLSEGHCQIYEWWKNPEEKKIELEKRFQKKEEKKETSGYEVVESEDLKREQEESNAPDD